MTNVKHDSFSGSTDGMKKNKLAKDAPTSTKPTKLTTSPENVSKTSGLPKDSQKSEGDPGEGAD